MDRFTRRVSAAQTALVLALGVTISGCRINIERPFTDLAAVGSGGSAAPAAEGAATRPISRASDASSLRPLVSAVSLESSESPGHDEYEVRVRCGGQALAAVSLGLIFPESLELDRVEIGGCTTEGACTPRPRLLGATVEPGSVRVRFPGIAPAAAGGAGSDASASRPPVGAGLVTGALTPLPADTPPADTVQVSLSGSRTRRGRLCDPGESDVLLARIRVRRSEEGGRVAAPIPMIASVVREGATTPSQLAEEPANFRSGPEHPLHTVAVFPTETDDRSFVIALDSAARVTQVGFALRPPAAAVKAGVTIEGCTRPQQSADGAPRFECEGAPSLSKLIDPERSHIEGPSAALRERGGRGDSLYVTFAGRPDSAGGPPGPLGIAGSCKLWTPLAVIRYDAKTPLDARTAPIVFPAGQGDGDRVIGESFRREVEPALLGDAKAAGGSGLAGSALARGSRSKRFRLGGVQRRRPASQCDEWSTQQLLEDCVRWEQCCNPPQPGAACPPACIP